MLKLNLIIKKKNEIQKLLLNFKIRLKQRSKFEFYFRFFLIRKKTNRNSFFKFYSKSKLGFKIRF